MILLKYERVKDFGKRKGFFKDRNNREVYIVYPTNHFQIYSKNLQKYS